MFTFIAMIFTCFINSCLVINDLIIFAVRAAPSVHVIVTDMHANDVFNCKVADIVSVYNEKSFDMTDYFGGNLCG